MTKKFLYFILPVVFFTVCIFVFAFPPTGGDFSLILSQLVNLGVRIVSGDGQTEITQTLGGNVASEQLKGGDYEMIGDIAGGISLLTVPSLNLDNIKVYPNPYKPGDANFGREAGIAFENLTQQAVIRIYNIAGELVFEYPKNDTENIYNWKAVNNVGEKVASGVYLYFITNDKGEKKKGKVGIIK